MAEPPHGTLIRAPLECLAHTFSMKKFYAGAIFFVLLGSPASHAQDVGESADAPLALKGSGSIGEAASQAAKQQDPAGTPLSSTDNAPFTLKSSGSFVGIPLSEVLPAPATPPSVSLPATPLDAAPHADEKVEEGIEIRPAAPQAAAAAAEADTDGGAKFGIAPIRWGGDVSESLRWRRYTTGSTSSAVSTLDNMQMLNLRASSYIWQPWIATVDGGIGLLHSNQSTTSSVSTSSNSNTITGNAGLSLFPRSRFPFRASYDVSDSRTSTSLVSAEGDYSSKRLGLSQSYRTVSGDSNFSVNYDQSTLSSSSFGDDIVSSLKGVYSTRFGTTQTAGMTVFHTESSQQGGNSGLDLNGFTAQHNYRSDSQLTVDTTASLTDSVWNTESLGTSNSSASRYLQAGTSASWRPDEEMPLYINGGVHFFKGESRYASTDSNTQSVGGNIMASYNPTRNIALSASGNATSVDSSGVSSLTTTQAVNASYNADVIKFGKDLSYNWNASSSLSNQTSSNNTNNQRITLSGSHSLFYPYLISSGSALNFTASQSLSNSFDRLYGTSNTLTHNGSMSWNAAQTESLSGSANVSVGDARTFGYGESDYQFAFMHLNGKKQFSMNSSLGANAGINWDRQGLTGRTSTGITGSVSYLHSRAFNVRGLRYSIIGTANTTTYDERLLGNVDAQRTQSGYSLEQYLNYRIGKLDTSLAAILSRYDGKDNASIFVRIGRFFGNM